MKPQAVTDYQAPKYPTKQEVLAQPRLLRRCVSDRRRFFGVGVSGALLATITLTGCKDQPGQRAGPADWNKIVAPDNSNLAPVTKDSRANELCALVAPIFEHGQGRGATGCVVVTPPVFLSEEEALVVIKEQLAKHGVVLNKEKVIIKDVRIAPGKWMSLDSIKGLDASWMKPEPVEMDLQDADSRIIVEFVSRDDYFRFGGKRTSSTVQSYDTKKIATKLRNELRAGIKQGICGVFYDPMARLDFNRARKDEGIAPKDRWKTALERTRDSARELLRQQVQDFADWLDEQEVI